MALSFHPIRTTGSSLLVHIPERLQTSLWVAGRQLYFDGTWDEHFRKRNAGVVVGCPERMGAEYLLARRGWKEQIVPCSAIQDDIRAGDVVYLDWTVSEASNAVNQHDVPDLHLPGGGGVYRAAANQVVARVREGALIPYGGYVFLREVYPDDVQAVPVQGHTLRLRVHGPTGLTLGSENILPLPYQGQVVLVGRPLRGQPGYVAVGDRVVVDKRVCGKAEGLPLRMKIEGEEYLVVRQEYIEAVFEPRGLAPIHLEAGPPFDMAGFLATYQDPRAPALTARQWAKGAMTKN